MSDPQPHERPSDPAAHEGEARPRKWLARWVKWRWLRAVIKVSLCFLLVLVLVYVLMALYFGVRLRATLNSMRANGQPLTMQEVCERYAGPPKENAAPLYLDALAQVKDPTSYNNIPASGQEGDLSKVREALEGDAEALRLLLAASTRPRCQFNVDGDPGMARLKRFSNMRSLARMFGCAIVVAAEDEQIEEAYRRVLAGLKLAEHVAMDPVLISQLVSYAIRAIIGHAAKDPLSKAPPPPALREQLSAAMVGCDLPEEFAICLRGERAMGLAITQDPRFPAARPLRYAWQFGYLRVIDRFIGRASQPYRLTGEGEAAAVQSLPWYCMFGKMLWGPLSRAKMERDKTIARLALLHIAMGLEVYRMEEGSYPKTLAALRSALNWTVPEDIFSGKDYVYRLEGDQFLLYSLGLDLDDDGGRPLGSQVYMPGDKGAVMKSEDGDLMWIPYGRKAEFRARAGYPPAKKRVRR